MEEKVPNAAFSRWLKAEKEEMAAVVQSGEDPETLLATQVLTWTKEKRLGVDVVMLIMVDSEFLIME